MEHTLAVTLGREVRAEMARQGITHSQLAAAIGISQPQASKRLRGAIEFRPSELESAAELLGVPVVHFFARPATAAA